MAFDSLSKRRLLKFWGWGHEDESLDPSERQLVATMADALGGLSAAVSEPRISDFALARPRVIPPESLAPIFSSSPYDRLSHAYGKSFADGVRMLLRCVASPPDHVVFPECEQQVIDVLDWASRMKVAVIPFGGGTSVCGGVETDVGQRYAGCISLDMQNLNHVHEVDEIGQSARIDAGIFGPPLEDSLRPHGLTLRHYPQSFEFSTLGGWIATRSGGHFAMGPTHIDDLVESVRLVTPAGVLETRRLPGSGAGPSADRLVIGSEGILGIITQAWMRLRRRPQFRASATVQFDSMDAAVAAVRGLSQSGLAPSNSRLLDAAEVGLNRVGDGSSPTLMLAFESAAVPVDHNLDLALELVRDYSAVVTRKSADNVGVNPASQWRNAFLRMPYIRNDLMRMGLIIDTFESAITWDRFDEFYQCVKRRVGEAMMTATGNQGHLSCRFTHVYPDGPAPYFTFAVAGAKDDLASVLAQWREIKLAANAAVVDLGGTITHHHAVGRDHRDGYHQQSPELYRIALSATKAALDSAGVLNPGVLIDPAGVDVGVTGALASSGLETLVR